jgi:hypothetical protein
MQKTSPPTEEARSSDIVQMKPLGRTCAAANYIEREITAEGVLSAAIVQALPKCRAVERALWFLAARLGDQTLGKTGEPALLHCVRTAAVLSSVFDLHDWKLAVTALLHDLLADTDVDYDEIAAEFGEEIADNVVLLTKPQFYPKQAREQIYDSSLYTASEDVLLVKLADYYDNLQCRRGRKRLRRTWSAAVRFCNALEERLDEPRLSRSVWIFRDFLAQFPDFGNVAAAEEESLSSRRDAHEAA